MARTQRRTLVIVADIHNPHDSVDITEARWAGVIEAQLRAVIQNGNMPAGLGVVLRHAEWDGTVSTVDTTTGESEISAIRTP